MLMVAECLVTGWMLSLSQPEHVSGAERREFPLPAYMGVRSFAPSLKVIPTALLKDRSPLT